MQLLVWSAISTGASQNDLYLFSLDKSGKGIYSVSDPKYLNSFNKDGFTNQPAFTPSGELLVSVRLANEDQNDIWLLDIDARKYRILTRTSETEYSPYIHPHEEHLTVLRKTGEQPMDQQVCNIDLRTGTLECVSGNFRDVAYYTWLGPNYLALFRIEGAVHRLSLYDVKENKSRRITTSIGRNLVSDRSGHLIFVHKFTNEYWYIKKYDPINSEIENITRTAGKNEDFAIAPDGTYFMGNGNLLFTFHPERDKEWRQIADLAVYGIDRITRLAISPDGKHLVLVSKE